MHFRLIVAALGAVVPVSAAADGFVIHGDDGRSSLTIGGFLQLDGRYVATGDGVDQFVLRSIRPDLRGTVLDHVDFRLFPDFAGGKLVVQDAYADVHYTDRIEVRVGKFKVPFGLERLQAEYATTFVDRGLPTQLAPNRDVGVQIFGELGIVGYQVGLFDGVADNAIGDGDVSSGKEVAARVFVRPGGGLGVGAAATFGDTSGTLASPDLPVYRTQAQTIFFQYRTDVTPVADGRRWRATAQADYYRGPIGVLAEYVRSVQRAALGDTAAHVTADAWQVLAQWVITGGDARYQGVAPGPDGAFDVAARVGRLSLDDHVFVDGLADPSRSARAATSFGLGADWYVNRALRLILDVERTQLTGGARPDETSIIARVQVVF